MGFGAEGIDIRQLLTQDAAIEEKNRIKGLVLSGAADAREGELGKVGLNFLFGGKDLEVWYFEERAVAFKPPGIGFFGL